jgi:hypothetical protein
MNSPAITVQALKSSRKLTNDKAQHPEVEATASRAKLLFPVESVSNLTCDEAGTLQRLLHHGETYGIWETPTDWAPPGARYAVVVVPIRKRIVHFLPPELKEHSENPVLNPLLDAAVLTLVRYLTLLRMGPSGSHCLLLWPSVACYFHRQAHKRPQNGTGSDASGAHVRHCKHAL